MEIGSLVNEIANNTCVIRRWLIRRTNVEKRRNKIENANNSVYGTRSNSFLSNRPIVTRVNETCVCACAKEKKKKRWKRGNYVFDRHVRIYEPEDSPAGGRRERIKIPLSRRRKIRLANLDIICSSVYFFKQSRSDVCSCSITRNGYEKKKSRNRVS